MNFAIRCVVSLVLLVLIAAPGAVADTITPAPTLPESMPWDLAALSSAPTFAWLDQDAPVQSLMYQGLPYDGHDTEVFAYYASPATLKGAPADGQSYPAVVLVHGGGGTAFEAWARLWAERGYAAIAMDLAGKKPDGTRLPNGGPDQGDDTKFGKIDAPVTEQWSYHAVANVILAHSLIRSYTEVDADRTAVTGISWGGYLTNIVAGLDHRFKAAVPVYGCGFLHEGSAWDDQFAAMSEEQRDRWVRLWDPSSYVGSAQMPVFFVNGTNDFAYWMESYAKTYGLVKGARNYCITVNMPHGHEAGWAPKEIGLFIDQYLIGGTPMAKVENAEATGDTVHATVQSEMPLKTAALHYTTDTRRSPDRVWETTPAVFDAGRIHAPAPPADTKIWFFTVTDERDAVVSSPLVFPGE